MEGGAEPADIPNDFVDLEFSAVGNLLTVLVNGEKVLETRDTMYPKAGNFGLNAFNARGEFQKIEYRSLDAAR